MDNATSRLAKRYQLLFTMPRTVVSISLSVASSVAILLGFAIFAGMPPQRFGILSLLLQGLLFASVALELMLLRGQPLATFHRLVGLSAVSNSLWLFLSFVGLILYFTTSLPQRYVFMMVVGLFAAVTLRGVAFRALFIDRFLQAVPLALLQPSLMALSIFLGGDLPWSYYAIAPPYIVGTASTSLVFFYVFQLGRVGSRFLADNAFSLFRAFMLVWVVDRPQELESYLEKISKATSVRTYRLETGSSETKSVVILPEIHPGPISKVGSSNLPYDFYRHFKAIGATPIVLHGISNHDLNLPSKGEVERFLLSLNGSKTVSATELVSRPVRVSVGGSTATCLAFGEVAFVMLTLAPNGMEDFPETVREAVVKAGLEVGFQHTLIVDCHNALGETISDDDCDNAVKAAVQAMREAKTSIRLTFRVGAANSSDVHAGFSKDIGPAGLSVLLIEVGGERYSLVAADANNARRGLREIVESHLRGKAIGLLELCTSDTHYMAAKVRNSKGYYAFGELSSDGSILGTIDELVDFASSRMAPSVARVSYNETMARTVGHKAWVDFSEALEGTFLYGKRLGFIVASIILAIAVMGNLSLGG